MKIGIQTRPWGVEMNRTNREQILAEVAKVGYDGFEIGAQHLDIDEPELLWEQAVAYGLDVVGIHVGGEIYDPAAVQAALADLERTIDYAHAAEATFVPYSGKLKEDKSEAELKQQADNLNRIGEMCRQRGLTLCYHNHFWEIENECAELQHICDHTDPALVSLCLDVGWVQRGGGNPPVVVERFFDRVGYFHIKDTTPDEWREVGHGDVNFPPLFELIQSRFDGWLVVEQDETKRKPVESARLSWAYLRGNFE